MLEKKHSKMEVGRLRIYLSLRNGELGLILEALSRHLEGIEKRDDLSPEDVRDTYLVDSRKSGDRRFKILLTETDKKTLFALLQQAPLPLNKSVRINQNFTFFQNEIKNLVMI